jgi:hypothetical protein
MFGKAEWEQKNADTCWLCSSVIMIICAIIVAAFGISEANNLVDAVGAIILALFIGLFGYLLYRLSKWLQKKARKANRRPWNSRQNSNRRRQSGYRDNSWPFGDYSNDNGDDDDDNNNNDDNNYGSSYDDDYDSGDSGDSYDSNDSYDNSDDYSSYDDSSDD